MAQSLRNHKTIKYNYKWNYMSQLYQRLITKAELSLHAIYLYIAYTGKASIWFHRVFKLDQQSST